MIWIVTFIYAIGLILSVRATRRERRAYEIQLSAKEKSFKLAMDIVQEQDKLIQEQLRTITLLCDRNKKLTTLKPIRVCLN